MYCIEMVEQHGVQFYIPHTIIIVDYEINIRSLNVKLESKADTTTAKYMVIGIDSVRFTSIRQQSNDIDNQY